MNKAFLVSTCEVRKKFHLPMVEYKEVKEYTRFRRFLINEGFVMMQQSVYCKLALNQSAVNLVKKKIDKNKPKDGLVQLLVITEKQYASMEYLVGNGSSNIEQSEERLIIL